jgi:hypothetical protein
MLTAGTSTTRRGRLKNGNPSGDYLAAPRCGARTRAGGCCRQPAMRNGRCRLHGGKSTGPRTPEGRARCAAARFVHGTRTAEMIALRSAAAHSARRLKAITRIARDLSAGHGLLRSDCVPAGLAEEDGHIEPPLHPDDRRDGPMGPPAADDIAQALEDLLHDASFPARRPAGHGLLRSNRPPPPERARRTSAPGRALTGP